MKVNKFSAVLDNIGIFASSLCAIHCAVVPLIITLLPLSSLGFLNSEWLETSMISIAILIGFLSLGLSFLKTHKKPLPILLLSIGFLLILEAQFSTEAFEYILTPIGGIIIAISHYVNWRLTAFYKNHSH